MKVKFYCDLGASCWEDVLDTVDDLNLEEGEWEGYTDDEKWERANEWAQDRLEIGYEELGGE